VEVGVLGGREGVRTAASFNKKFAVTEICSKKALGKSSLTEICSKTALSKLDQVLNLITKKFYVGKIRLVMK